MKIAISPAQAVLMLIDRYQHDADLVRRLSEVLISGINDDEEMEFLKSRLNDDIFKDYRIRFDYKMINEDPVKRYFETHLAYHTLKAQLNTIDIELLREQFETIKRITFKKVKERVNPFLISKFINFISESLQGRTGGNEYSIAFNAIQHGSAYETFNAEEKEKILLLIQSALLSTFSGKLEFLPVDIYGTGLFNESVRGRLQHDKAQSDVRSRNMGLLKSYMPMSVNDLAYVDNPSNYLRPADQFQLENPNTEWTSEHFASLMHPYSSGISGTTLSHLRMILYLQPRNLLKFDDLQSFSAYFKLFCSAMLYNGGGHSYYEFLSTLIQVPELRDEYEVFMPGIERMTMNSLLLDGNAQAFDQALRETINYNKQIIRLKSVNMIINLKSDIDDLNHECSIYRDYLYGLVDQEINNLNLLDKTVNRLRVTDLTPIHLDDLLNQQSISANTRLLFEKFKIVLELIDILNGNVDFEASIQNFKNKFASAKEVLESNRDVASLGLLKVLDKNLQRFNLRQSKGGLFVKNIQIKLTALDGDHDQKNTVQSLKRKAKQ